MITENAKKVKPLLCHRHIHITTLAVDLAEEGGHECLEG